MDKKIAIVTQSYKNDYRECKLLCESIDRFASEISHFIFVNDEDADMFADLNYGKHIVYKKSVILPKYLIRLPWKIMGHHFHVSPFTIPVREWIIQQICKLGVFEVIGKEFDVTLNIDSETVLMKPFRIDELYKDGKWLMYRVPNINEPSHDDYCNAAYNLLKYTGKIDDINKWNYMNTPVAFVRENIETLLKTIGNGYIGGWKRHLCNTYRFSEYYTYAIFTEHYLHLKNHFITDKHVFPQIDISECEDVNDFNKKIESNLNNDFAFGVWLQKKDRKRLSEKYLSFDDIQNSIYHYWNK